MKNTFLVVLAAVVISGCASQKAFTTTCGGTSGFAATHIKYGDSQIVVKPKSNVRADREFHFKLQPQIKRDDPVDYRDALVTVAGKDAVSSWISGSATYNTAPGAGHTFFAGCVPGDASEGDIYHYDVTVQHVGDIDPRAEVVR